MRRFAIVLAALALGCAHGGPTQPPISISPLAQGPGEKIIVQQAVLIFDASSTIIEHDHFNPQKRVFRGFVDGMPQGTYLAESVAFGGYKRERLPLAPFARPELQAHADAISMLGEGTPIDRVLGEVRETLGGKSERAAVVLFSDGLATDPVGRKLENNNLVLDEARAVVAGYRGTVCFHTVQAGSDPAGTELLQAIAKVTPCGTYRTLASVSEAGGLTQFERQVFVGAAPVAQAAAAPGDEDGDGVLDPKDQCPRTPHGVKVDSRGCWTLPEVEFDTGSATLRPIGRQKLEEQVLPVLRNNPNLRLRIDGYTDSSGSEAFNQSLSERRAVSVKDFLVSAGVSASRLETRGFGESNPIAPNDSKANMQMNRRTELTVID